MKISRLVPAASLGCALGVLLFVGCNKSDPAAQSDWTLRVSADPASLELGANNEGTSTITATLFDKTGAPRTGVGVRFSTTAGRMDSAGALVTTNGRGEARDVLHAGQNATVTVSSGSLTQTVAITVGGANEPPVAGITISPSGKGHTGQNYPVTFSGATSSDAEDGVVSKYHWVMISDNPDPGVDPTFYDETTTNQAIVRRFTNKQRLSVQLTVYDSDNATNSTSTDYEIVRNYPPTAKITSPGIGTVTPDDTYPGTYKCAVSLSGCQSTDPEEGSPSRYEWTWQDRADPPSPSCTQAHTFQALSASTTFTVTLVVHDNGDGTCPPLTNLPTDNCPDRGSSPAVSTTVTCNVPVH